MDPVQQAPENGKPKDGLAADRFDLSLKLGLALAMVTIFLLITGANIAEPDLWGHVRMGQDILRLGHVPTADPYSYVNQGYYCLDHEWLFEVMMAWCFNLAGALGLVLFKGLLIFGIVCLMLLALRRSGFSVFSQGMLVLIALQVMGPGIVVIRPHLMTYLLFTATCVILRWATLGSTKCLWFLPPIMILWVNCHGGFLTGLAVIVLWAVIQTLVLWRTGNRLADIRRIWLVVFVTFGAHFVNPFGARLLTFLSSVVQGLQLEIGEWNPLSLNTESGLYYLACCAVLIFSLFLTTQKRQPSLVVLVLLTMLTPLMAKRHLPLFAIALVCFVPEHLASLLRLVTSKVKLPRIWDFSWQGKLIMTVASIGAAGFVLFRLSQCFGQIVPMPDAPVAAINLLEEMKAEGNIVCFFDWGEYILWRLGPRVKVSIDGRRESTYPIKVYLQNIEFMRGVGRWDAILDDYPSNLALVNKQLPCFNLMKLKPGWTLVYENGDSALFVRNGSPLIAQIQQRLKTGKPVDATETGFP